MGKYVVISINGGNPIWTPEHYNPYYGDPQSSNPNFKRTSMYIYIYVFGGIL